MNAVKPEGEGIAILNILLEKQERTPEGDYLPESYCTMQKTLLSWYNDALKNVVEPCVTFLMNMKYKFEP